MEKDLKKKQLKCVRCNKPIERLVTVSGAMNVPGHESLDMDIPVKLIEIGNDKAEFKSIMEEEQYDDWEDE